MQSFPKMVFGAFAIATFLAVLSNSGGADQRTDLYGDPLPQGAIARLGTLRYRVGNRVKGIAFVPGSHQITAATERGIGIWNAQTGKLVRNIWPVSGSPSSSSVRAFALSPDGAGVAGVIATFRREERVYDHQLTVWDVKTGKPQTTIAWTPPPRESTQVMAFTPDGATIAAGDESGKLHFWDLKSKSKLLSHTVIDGPIQSIAFAPGGETVAVSGPTGVALWRWPSGDKPQPLHVGEQGLMVLAFSPDGKWLACGSNERRGIRVWRVADRRLAWRIEASDARYYPYPNGLEFSADSKLLVLPVLERGGRVEVRQAASGKLVRRFDADQVGMLDAAISSDQKLIAGVDRTLNVWRLDTGEPLHKKFAGHDDPPFGIEFTLNGSQVVTGGYDGTVRVWDAARGRPVHQMRHERGKPVVAVAVSPDARWIASAGFDYTVRLWDRESGAQRYKLFGHARSGAFRSNTVRFTPDSGRLFSFGNDMYLRVWDVRSGKAQKELEVRPTDLEFQRGVDGAVEVAGEMAFGGPGADLSFQLDDPRFTPDCKYLLVKIKGGLHIIDTKTGREVDAFQPDDRLGQFAVSSDGKTLATVESRVFNDGTATEGQTRREAFVRLRRLATPKKVLREIKLPADFGYHPAFSPSGNLIAASMYQRIPDRGSKRWISVWETATGKEVARVDRAYA